MIGLQIINLLPKHQRPEIFAQKLDGVERVGEARPVTRESSDSQALAHQLALCLSSTHISLTLLNAHHCADCILHTDTVAPT